jgi:cytidylate kinase
MRHRVPASEQIRPILAAVRAVPREPKGVLSAPRGTLPFVTISREPGSGAWTLAQEIADGLNQLQPDPAHPWTAWDGQLVEKVAQDHHLSRELVEALVQADHNWLGDFFTSLAFYEDPDFADEIRVLHGVVSTMRALANAGRVILVGRGSVFVTRKMPGGIHLRLVAPLPWRIARVVDHFGISEQEAAERIRQTTRRREAYWHRYWPTQTVTPELFTLTINASEVSHEKIVKLMQALVGRAATEM